MNLINTLNIKPDSVTALFDQEVQKLLDSCLKSHLDQGTSKTFNVIDLFSGCGGLSYGFHILEKLIGNYHISHAIDSDKHANNTYQKNFEVHPLQIDLLTTSSEEVVNTISISKNAKPNIVVGGPPCVAFSSHKKKDNRRDIRSSLVVKFADIAIKLNAELIVMENVPDLLAKRHWPHFLGFSKLLQDNNYNLSYGIINMAEFGVPQSRHRLICLASKNFFPSLPVGSLENHEFRTVRDAISHLPHLEPGQTYDSDPLHVTSRHRKETIKLLKQVPADGGSRPKGIGPKCLDRVKGFTDVYGRLSWDRPSVTLTARCRTPSCGRYVHPEQHRGLSVREAALLQGFPTNFEIEGPFDDKFKQIGNAVSPLFSVALALHIHGLLNGKTSGLETRMELPQSPPFGSYSGSINKENRNQSSNGAV